MVKVSSNINLNDLMEILQQEIKEITLNDLKELSLHFTDELKYLPNKYKDKYIDSVLNSRITRFNSLKNDKKKYDGELIEKDIININELMNKNNDKTIKLLNIINIYTIYFLKEPIHPLNSVFPGSLKIYKKGKNYYCPIKKYHINNKDSLCKYCIAKMIEE